MRGRLQRFHRLATLLVGPWILAVFVSAELSGIGRPDQSLTGELVRAGIAGFLIGTASAWAEIRLLAHWSRRYPLAAALALRTVIYAVVVASAVMVIIALVSWRDGVGPVVAFQSPELRAVFASRPFWTFLGLLVLASFFINFALQLRRVLGPETLKALFLGTYRRPRREARAFVFLDLTDSTAIAERLGPLQFTEFKNDFFADVAEPVLATGGRIVQYVGDEVMVSWPMARALKDGAPLRFFWLVEDRIAARAERYTSAYGVAPRFKAGVHGGEVVTAEVGDLKRDIVHSGDVVNTAARIEAQCRARGERLLVSAELLARMPLPDDVACHCETLGELPLRGKAAPVGVTAVRRGAALTPTPA